MIKIGLSGTDGHGHEEIFKLLEDTGLKAMEVAFTHGVRMSDTTAIALGKKASEHGISLSIHAPYYINLSSVEEEKIIASKKRIIDSCWKGKLMGATHIVFHAGFYQKQSKEAVNQKITAAIVDMMEAIDGWGVKLAPEAMGKPSQFGTVDDLLRLRKDTGCSMCIDFAHIKALNGGDINYKEVLEKIGEGPIHCHFSGIEWGDKGEKRHLRIDRDEAKLFLKALIHWGGDATVICESPEPLEDAKLLKNLLITLNE